MAGSKKLRDYADVMRRLLRILKREPLEPPEDPYAYVGAPKKPRLPQRSATAAETPE
jgi:hypothetical protein